MRRALLVAVAVLAATALSATGAAADATYHSAHIQLFPDAGTAGGTGFVENSTPTGRTSTPTSSTTCAEPRLARRTR
jgi:hypothetical protein